MTEQPATSLTLHPDFVALRHAAACLNDHQREQLLRLLQEHGVAGQYIEYSGHVATIPLSDRMDILQLKGVSLLNDQGEIDEAGIEAHLQRLVRDRWERPLPPLLVLTAGAGSSVTLRLPQEVLDSPWHWQLQAENGSQFDGEFDPMTLPELAAAEVNGDLYSARELSLWPLQKSQLPPGYHRLSVRSGKTGVAIESSLVIAPERCHQPPWTLAGERLWGFSVQLYSLRSQHNWGMGDLGDLRELIPLAASRGADFLVLNPLHALDPRAPDNCSPYSPSDRRRLNPLYIDIDAEEDFSNCRQFAELPQQEWYAQMASLRRLDSIDYPAVAGLKQQALRWMFGYFLEHHIDKDSERARCFANYVEGAGKSLQDFARFEANRAWHDELEADPRFTLYSQWLIEQQLAVCQRLAVDCGMRVGLIRDLAVGGSASGAETTLNDDLFCQLASIGAPPDPLAPQGQNWGLPPPDPQVGKNQGHQHFIELLRANMKHCGALRIDHVMALMRLWWCPQRSGRGGGAYVHYPADNLFALLRLESVRNQCLVIGEDLGVVPPEVRGYLSSSAIFSNVLFYFEKYDAFHFKKPEHYAAHALAMVANHDVPTLAAWWNGADLRLRRQLRLITDEQELEEQVRWREGERQQVLDWLTEQWLLPQSWQGDIQRKSFDFELCAAIFRCCARSAAQMISIQLDDLLLLETPVNIPGTSTEYPNWRRRLPVDLSQLFASPATALLLADLSHERGRQGHDR